MEEWDREALRSTNEVLREEIERVRAVLEKQQARMGEIREQLDQLRMQATSSDGLVEVTVDADGMVVRTRVSAKAMRSTPQKVEAAFTEAARAAASAAREHSESLVAPLVAETDVGPDLSDLVPEMPDVREIRAKLLGESGTW